MNPEHYQRRAVPSTSVWAVAICLQHWHFQISRALILFVASNNLPLDQEWLLLWQIECSGMCQLTFLSARWAHQRDDSRLDFSGTKGRGAGSPSAFLGSIRGEHWQLWNLYESGAECRLWALSNWYCLPSGLLRRKTSFISKKGSFWTTSVFHQNVAALQEDLAASPC